MTDTTTYSHDSKGKREDVHRPSSINPGDYEYESVAAHRKEGELSGGPAGVCHHCGKAIVWEVHFLHTPSAKHVTFGYICAGILELTDNRIDHEMELLKRRVANEQEKLEREKREAEWQEKKRKAAEDWRESHEEMVEWFDNHDWKSEKFSFLLDMKSSLESWGKLTDNQTAATQRLIDREKTQLLDRFLDEQKNGPKPDAPEGRVEVEGTIFTRKPPRDDAQFPQWKMGVKLDDGNKVFGSIPENIWDAAQVDARVKFTATFELSKDDPHFAYFKRPAKAVIV